MKINFMQQKWIDKPTALTVLLYPVGLQEITRWDIVGINTEGNRQYLGEYRPETQEVNMSANAWSFFADAAKHKQEQDDKVLKERVWAAEFRARLLWGLDD